MKKQWKVRSVFLGYIIFFSLVVVTYFALNSAYGNNPVYAENNFFSMSLLVISIVFIICCDRTSNERRNQVWRGLAALFLIFAGATSVMLLLGQQVLTPAMLVGTLPGLLFIMRISRLFTKVSASNSQSQQSPTS